MKKGSVLLILMLTWLSGCGSQTFELDKITLADLCVVHTENSNKLCYGQSKSDVENILGEGQDVPGAWKAYDYDGGIRLAYREDRVSAIILRAIDTSVMYKTARGVGFGDGMNRVNELYGEENALTSSIQPDKVMYLYDSVNKAFIGQDEKLNVSNDGYDDIYMIDIGLTRDGLVEVIMLSDAKVAFLLE